MTGLLSGKGGIQLKSHYYTGHLIGNSPIFLFAR